MTTELTPNKQAAEGSEITQVGRDYVQNIGLILDPVDLKKKFDNLDSRIINRIGNPVSPTADGIKIEYSSEKLFTSLIHVGLSPINAFNIIEGIGDHIAEEIEKDKTQFSTAHIRRAVSNAILDSSNLQLSRNERREQANKYARSYGNPMQMTMVVYDNGDSSPINYEYAIKKLIPNLITKYTGGRKIFHFQSEESDAKGVLSINNLNHMAQELISSVKRLGVYQIRYQTLFAIGEELALQLPHPWIVSNESRFVTSQHDIERARYHLSCIVNEDQQGLRFWRVAIECFNHICSHILSSYGSVIGGGDNAAPNTLRNFTRLAVSGENQNIALWDFCEISELDSDIMEFGWTIKDLHIDIKNLQRIFQRMREDDKSNAVGKLTNLTNLCEKIHVLKSK